MTGKKRAPAASVFLFEDSGIEKREGADFLRLGKDGRSMPRPYGKRPRIYNVRCDYFWVELVRARKTRSSMGTVRVKRVGVAAAETATAWAELEMAGPAGLLCRELASPGTSEIRVVAGVQAVAAPKQVSRTKT